MTSTLLNVYVRNSSTTGTTYWPTAKRDGAVLGDGVYPEANCWGLRCGNTTPAWSDEWMSDPQCHGVTVPDGQDFHVALPDGTQIEVKPDGSYEIKDADAKVIYRANRVREFNRFVNASDVLEGFIRFCGAEAQVRKEEMLELPIRLFIGWLILEAAKADQEPEPDDIKLLPDLRRAVEPRCRSCGRFLKRAMKLRKLEFCGTSCFERQLEHSP